MKLSKSSWHYLLFDKTFERNVPNNLCPYFWLLVWAIVCFPFNFIWNFPAMTIHLVARIWNKEGWDDWADSKYMNDCFKISTEVNLILICLISMVGLWINSGNGIFQVFGVIGYLLLITALCAIISDWYKERPRKKTYKPQKPNIFNEFIKAKYNRMCPKIEWTSTKNQPIMQTKKPEEGVREKAMTAMQELIVRLEKTNQEYYSSWKKAKGKDKKQWDNAMSVQTIAVINAKNMLEKLTIENL